MSTLPTLIDELRKCEREWDGSNMFELARMCRDAADMLDENAKLRELVQTMMRYFEDGDWCNTCEVAKECDAQEQYEKDCLMRGVFHDRMRELGIEVDE